MIDAVDYAIYVGGLPWSPHSPAHLFPSGNIDDIGEILTDPSP
jgi:hypothetical protein